MDMQKTINNDNEKINNINSNNFFCNETLLDSTHNSDISMPVISHDSLPKSLINKSKDSFKKRYHEISPDGKCFVNCKKIIKKRQNINKFTNYLDSDIKKACYQNQDINDNFDNTFFKTFTNIPKYVIVTIQNITSLFLIDLSNNYVTTDKCNIIKVKNLNGKGFKDECIEFIKREKNLLQSDVSICNIGRKYMCSYENYNYECEKITLKVDTTNKKHILYYVRAFVTTSSHVEAYDTPIFGYFVILSDKKKMN